MTDPQKEVERLREAYVEMYNALQSITEDGHDDCEMCDMHIRVAEQAIKNVEAVETPAAAPKESPRCEHDACSECRDEAWLEAQKKLGWDSTQKEPLSAPAKYERCKHPAWEHAENEDQTWEQCVVCVFKQGYRLKDGPQKSPPKLEVKDKAYPRPDPQHVELVTEDAGCLPWAHKWKHHFMGVYQCETCGEWSSLGD